MSIPAPLLDVRGLGLVISRNGQRSHPVSDASLHVMPGEILGLMGRSGAGKTLLALSIIGLLPRAVRIAGGSILWKGDDTAAFDDLRWRRERGAGIGMVFQDPMTALHPMHRVDRQVAEALLAHDPALGRRGALERAAALLERTGVPRARLARAGHPFEWSGGMRQRALIAMAIANRPALLIADEPTTALDVTTQARILDLLRGLRDEMGTAMLFITHDPAIMAGLADRVAILHEGRILATGPTDDVLRDDFEGDRAAQTRAETALSIGRERGPALSSASTRPPDSGAARETTPVPPDAARLRVDDLSVRYVTGAHRLIGRRGVVSAVDGVSFFLGAGEVLGIVGESGCGKSTLARALVRLEQPGAGRILLGDLDLVRAAGRVLQQARARIQIIFQDPFSSLNPGRRIGESIAQPLHVHGRFEAAGGVSRVRGLLEQVDLPASYASRLPRELSGGERQRVAIARALALDPEVLVLDEPVSSLDRPTQRAIVRLLDNLRTSLGLACIFIAHDLRLVREIADRVAVMYLGRFVETGPTRSLFDAPSHPYTQALLSAMPADPGVGTARRVRVLPLGDVPDAEAPPPGCRFHPRCWKVQPRCRRIRPELVEGFTEGHACACHFADPPPVEESRSGSA